MNRLGWFAVGLWTGALVTGACGAFYLYGWQHSHVSETTQSQEQWETRFQQLQKEHVRTVAETQRLRGTVAELLSNVSVQAQPPPPNPQPDLPRVIRPLRYREGGGAAGVDTWIVESVLNPDAQALPKLEQAAQQNNQYALDALALLADRDNAEALTRVWSSATLNAAGKARATMLLAATVEVNPRAEELLQSLAAAAPGNTQLLEAALAGLVAPDFATRLARGTDIAPPPHFKPDYAIRLRIVDSLRAAVTDENLSAALDRIRAKLVQRGSEIESLTQ